MHRTELGLLHLAIAASLTGCWFTKKHECKMHADCDAGYSCVETSNETRVCAESACDSDNDCGTDETCELYRHDNGCDSDYVQICAGPDDACVTDDDCADVTTSTGYGALSCLPTHDSGIAIDGPLQCTETRTNCAIGRPLTVESSPRVAPSTRRSDWAEPHAVAAPDPARAAHWAAVAAMEHASVASFARFSLELMALGAPPELIRGAHLAALDEIEHARLAYGLVERFSGEPSGPGPLSLDGVVPATDLTTIAKALVAEACVGETVGAALARDEASKNPDLVDVLERIADDETRHAALAWRVLEWMVTDMGLDPGPIDGWIAEALDELVGTLPDPDACLARSVGRQVIEPLARQIRSGTASQP